MYPILEKIENHKSTSFRIKRDRVPHINVPWHFHPEYELVLILKGEGRRFVGDCIDDFCAGDLVLLGPNLPHVWINSEDYYKVNKDVFADIVVIHFLEDAFGHNFFALPEMENVKILLQKSSYGISIGGATGEKVSSMMVEMLLADPSKKLIGLLHILDLVSKNTLEQKLLSRENYAGRTMDKHYDRLKNVFQYIFENYYRDISLKDVANIANMSKSSFCRYFKQVTSKCFSDYINEIRIGYAKKIISTESKPVYEVAYQCGYNNPSYFNKQFKKYVGKTPLEYLTELRVPGMS
jgi:AraC-like DNA-binding protein